MDKRYDQKVLFCNCGCGNGVVLKAYKNKEIGMGLELVSNHFYFEQHNTLHNIKEKIKRIWYILANKEYCYFDIIIDRDELKDFKEFVAKLYEEECD